MKILAIRIKNLASLEGLTDIDFTTEPLCSAGIFAITGPTGAGKSTILDALCLALFGKTPRYTQAKESGIDLHDVIGSKISQGDPKGILRDGTGDGFAEVDFVGIDNNSYRATWNVRRARGRADGNMQQDTVSMWNLSANIQIPGRKTEVQREIERLVGLNFEQFTRSVLLAQGDFTAFLKANKDEKASLLEKLTGTHIYSQISMLIYERARREEQGLRDLNLKKEGIQILSAEELESLKQEKENLDIEIKTRNAEKNELTKELQWHEQLLRFTSSVEEARLIEEKALQEKENASQRVIILTRIDQVQDIRVSVNSLGESRSLQAQKSAEFNTLNLQIEELIKQKEEIAIKLNDAENTLNIQSKVKQDSVAVLADARRLDTIIKEKAQQVSNSETELSASKRKYDTIQTSVKEGQKKLSELEIKIKDLKKWIVENQSAKSIAENYNLIVSKLNDAKKIVADIQNLNSEIDSCQGNIAGAGVQINKINEELVEKKQRLSEVNGIVEVIEKLIGSIDIEKIREEKKQIDKAVEETVESQGHWKLLYSSMNDYEDLKSKLIKNNNDLSSNEGLLKEVDQQVLIYKTKKETSFKLLEKARLEVAADVEKLRATLRKGSACPVCGSEEHPYAHQSPELNRLLTGIETEYNNNEKEYGNHLGRQSGLNEAIISLKKTIDDQNILSNSKQTVLNELQEKWGNFSIINECLDIPKENLNLWIEDKLKSLRKNQESLQTNIQNYDINKRELDLNKSTQADLEKDITDLDNKLKDFTRSITSNTDMLNRARASKEDALLKMSGIEGEIGKHFTGEDWVEKWRKNSDGFIGQIKLLSDDWNNNVKSLETGSQSLALLETELLGLDAQLKDSHLEWDNKKTLVSQLKADNDKLQNERSAIFGGTPADIVEATIEKAFKDASNVVAELKIKSDELVLENTKLIALSGQLKISIDQTSQSVANLTQEIEQWIQEYNVRNNVELAFSDIINLLKFSHDWIDKERKSIQVVNDKVTTSSSVFRERQDILQNHESNRLSDKTLEAINDLLGQNQELLTNSTKRNNEISFIQNTDSDNNKKIGDLLQQINEKTEIVENWIKLNEVIGSADGKKFRQVAQEYTLDVLLDYANVHLKTISQRYAIQRIPESLGLQVVDQEMGNEIRTVYSLSGGESFLVSLALALGLASLSSRKMKVESLFIDEGFGSLDPNTLNIAMDALERLHNQGRKVGVISHVQEMTERIPVQIKVKKLASGKGKVEVISIV